MKLSHNFFISILLLISFTAVSQEIEISDATTPNNLYNSESLQPFFQKLKADSSEAVTIVHLGDSHIQADMIGSKMRRLMQADFGNAGRGYVFPYKMAKTNGSADARFSNSNVVWDVKRITRADSPNYIGIPGYRLSTSQSAGALFSFRYVLDSTSRDQKFSEIELLYEGNASFSLYSDEAYFVPVADPILVTGSLKSLSFRLSYPASGLQMNINQAQDFSFHGMVLKNKQAGIYYHSIGVNGATVRNYLQSAAMADEVKGLKPSLLIISLGTNESVSNIDSLSYSMQLASLVQNLSYANCTLLFTTPADNDLRKKVRRRKKKIVHYVNNAKSKEIRDWTLAFCENQHIACWDMYEALGGKGSMKQMVASGDAAKDHIHFSKKGYQHQAELLYQALKQAYDLWEK